VARPDLFLSVVNHLRKRRFSSELLDQQQKIELELTALREQATQELDAFSTPKRRRRSKAEIAVQEKKSGTDREVEH
jgi:hypothetical protein